MAKDPRVELTFSLNLPRHEATGVDPNDLRKLMERIDRWEDWCRIWSEEGARHKAMAEEAKKNRFALTAAEAYIRASIYYHYGKHLFADHPEEYRVAHENMLQCYSLGAPGITPPLERVEFPYKGISLPGWLRIPCEKPKPPVAVILPGLDACKEELHSWAQAFVNRGIATVTLDGPGQGETAFRLPATHEWGPVLGAVIDVLEKRSDVDGARVGVVGQSLGAIYAPLAAAGEPRLKACIANCGPYDWGQVLPKMPPVSQEVFRIRSHANTMQEAYDIAKKFTLDGVAERITCPLLVVFGAGDRVIPPSEGERLIRAAKGPSELVVYDEGNHVCFNISYKFRPLTADWMSRRLGV